VTLAESWPLPAAAVPTQEPHGAATRVNLLTPRQQEVAVLVARGLTNRQMAERLVVSERAAAAHVENILNRLGVRLSDADRGVGRGAQTSRRTRRRARAELTLADLPVICRKPGVSVLPLT
jgi:DNA-binding NarL/FixJ family response regulator